MKKFILALGALAYTQSAVATPYFDPSKVPLDNMYPPLVQLSSIAKPRWLRSQSEAGLDVLRVGVTWKRDSETFSLRRFVREKSGTPGLYKRAPHVSPYGSYQGLLRSIATNKVLARDSIGTGKEYRKMIDEITFRFPLPSEPVVFELIAENPVSGKMERVLSERLEPSKARIAQAAADGSEIRELKRPTSSGDSVRVNIYAEGYLQSRRDTFWRDADKTVRALVTSKFPGVERMHFYAVFKPSNERLGTPAELGGARASRDTHLGLFFPYWNKFGRWFHVIYPAQEDKFRRGLALAPYDYAIVLADESDYWGIGNFRVMTAVPAQNSNFTYLLLHEAGHYFGLNEEYEEGGSTELEFAPGIFEPWSPNITFLRDPSRLGLKWNRFVGAQTELPTPRGSWQSSPPAYGAYRGGYGSSPPLHHSHKPGFNCVMEASKQFCAICHNAVAEIVTFDAGSGRFGDAGKQAHQALLPEAPALLLAD